MTVNSLICSYYLACFCNEQGSSSPDCDPVYGKCNCKSPIIGDKCEFCPPETYNFPLCTRESTIYLKLFNVCFMHI